jgi:tetratricopeptide (TPR) repeat protein
MSIADTPDDPYCQFNLGCQLAYGGHPEEALAGFEQAIRLVGDTPAPSYFPLCLLRAGQLLLTLARPREGLHYVKRALALFPDLADAHYAAGRLHAATDDRAAAREAFVAALQHGGRPDGYLSLTEAAASTWKPHFELGVLEMLEQNWEPALSHFQKALQFKPDHAAAWANQGQCHECLGDTARAAECIRWARSLGLALLDEGGE